MSRTDAADLVGSTLSHFYIISRIDGGGMGVVYRARDQQLRRDVAIKVLPPEALTDETARKRFRHEALTLARLNHPNIETILGFEAQDGIDYLIVEYVDGQTLEARLQSGPLPEEEARPLAISIVEGLEAAHAKGVVHCDLKPVNVGLTVDGRVKILDFGLAQVLRPADANTTLTRLASDPDESDSYGGTLPYMAPEQLLGRKLDGRVDLYALGVLLFRMVVGRLPFWRPLQPALIEDIIHAPPPRPRALNSNVSDQLEAIILRCLEKDPGCRYQTAADLHADLVRLVRSKEQSASESRPARPWPRFSWDHTGRALAGLSLAAVIAVAAVVLHLNKPPPHNQERSDRQVTFTGQAYYPAISPDGQYAAFVERSRVDNRHRLLVQDLAGGEPLEVFSGQGCYFPLWSPDGRTILCQAVRDSDHAAYLVPKLGGTPRRLPSGGIFHSWAPDGRRFVSTSAHGRALHITDVATGDTSVISLNRVSARVLDLDWSSTNRILVLTTDDGGHYSFWTVVPGHGGPQKWFDDSTLVSSPRWSPAGDALYFVRGGGQEGLMDLCKVRWRKPARHRRVHTQILIRGLAMGSYFTVSRDGRRLLYTRELSRSNLWRFDVTRRGIQERGQRLTTSTSLDCCPSVSPDGKWIAFERDAGSQSEIFRVSIDGGDARQLTFMKVQCQSPVWSPSGDTIAFLSNQGGVSRVWRVPAGGGPARPYSNVEVSTRPISSFAWAPGREVFCMTGNRDYALLDPGTGRATVIGTEDSLGWIQFPRFSPDGSRLAWWTPDQAGVWVMTLAERVRTRILATGPVLPAGWSPDGHWIYGLDWRASKPSLVRVASAGGKDETPIGIPTDESVVQASLSPDGSWGVCVVLVYQPDVWLAENFDPR